MLRVLTALSRTPSQVDVLSITRRPGKSVWRWVPVTTLGWLAAADLALRGAVAGIMAAQPALLTIYAKVGCLLFIYACDTLICLKNWCTI